MPASVLRTVVTTEGVQSATTQLAGLGQQINTIGTTGTAQLSKFGVTGKAAFTAIGIAAAQELKKAVSTTQELGGEIRSLSRLLGLSAEDAGRLRGAAQLLGVSTDSLGRSFGVFSKHLVDGGAAFAKYGISLRKTDGSQKDFNTLLGEASDKYNALAPGVERTAFVLDVFGRSGRDLIPILAKGSAGLQELGDKATDLGLVLSQKDLDATKALALATRELAAAWQGAHNVVGIALIPVLQALADAIGPIMAGFNALPGPLKTIVAVMLLLGFAIGKVALAGGILSNLLPFLAQRMGVAAAGTTAAAGSLTLYTANAQGAIIATKELSAAQGSSAGGGLLGALGGVGPLGILGGVALGAFAAHAFTASQKAKDFAHSVDVMSTALKSGTTTVEDLNTRLDEQHIPGWARAEFQKAIDTSSGSVRGLTGNVNKAIGSTNTWNRSVDGIVGSLKAAGRQFAVAGDVILDTNGVLQTTAGILGTVAQGFRTASSEVNAYLNNLRALESSQVAIPGSGGIKGGHASGIWDSPTTHVAWVGERGPELMVIPKHGSIIPAGAAGRTASGGLSVTVHVHGDVNDGERFEQRVEHGVVKALAKVGRR
jgi:hypothetical protein